MSKAEEQRARKLAREEKLREFRAMKREQLIDRAVEDLPDFGINLSRDEIGAWLSYAEELRELEAKNSSPKMKVLRARLWDEGWVLAIAMLYRMNPGQDVSAPPTPPEEAKNGPSYYRFASQRRSTLYLAFQYSAESMGATMSVDGERVEQHNLEEAFPELKRFLPDRWHDELRFDHETAYQIHNGDYDTFKSMLTTLANLGEALKAEAWRDEVTSMCDQLSESWRQMASDLDDLSFPCDDPDEGRFVAGVYLNRLDQYFSLEQGHFAYTMQILNLQRGHGIEVSSLTESLVGAFTAITDMLAPYADANCEVTEQHADI